MAKRKRRKEKIKAKEKVEEEPRQHEFFTPTTIIVLFAIIEIALIVAMYPSYRIGYLTRQAVKHRDKENYQTSLKYYEKLYRIAPDSAKVNLEIAQVLMKLGEYSRAFRHLQVPATLLESQRYIRRYMGECLIEMGREREAVKYFEEELKLNPEDPPSNYYVGLFYFKQKKYRQAAAHFQRISTHWRYKKELQDYWKVIQQHLLASTATPS